jgi:rrf2 family protein (putative transcriptional regulator)
MPTLGKNVEYALHTLVYFVGNPPNTTINIKALSKFQNISESYLAKTFTKLKKSGLLRSNLGTKGGYSLAREAKDITFLDVVLAVEGELSFFECNGVREGCILLAGIEKPWEKNELCTIHKAMLEIEDEIKKKLSSKTLLWLYDSINKQSNKDFIKSARHWFQNNTFSDF